MQFRPHLAKAILSKKKKTGNIILHDFITYHKVRKIKTVWHCHKKRPSGKEYRRIKYSRIQKNIVECK